MYKGVKSVLFKKYSVSDNEIIGQLLIDRLKEKAKIDRSETCFAGLGKVQTQLFTASPSDVKRLRSQKFW